MPAAYTNHEAHGHTNSCSQSRDFTSAALQISSQEEDVQEGDAQGLGMLFDPSGILSFWVKGQDSNNSNMAPIK